MFCLVLATGCLRFFEESSLTNEPVFKRNDNTENQAWNNQSSGSDPVEMISALILKSLWVLTPVSGTCFATLSMAHPFVFEVLPTAAGSCEVKGNGLQSLNDDSLSELVPATSWSSALLIPPSGTGASGVLSKAAGGMCLIF